jgi:hypothetical protein
MTPILLVEVGIAARRLVERHRELSQDRDDAIEPKVMGSVKRNMGQWHSENGLARCLRSRRSTCDPLWNWLLIKPVDSKHRNDSRRAHLPTPNSRIEANLDPTCV